MPRERKRGGIVLKSLREGALTTADLFVNFALEPFRHSYKGSSAPLRGKEFSIRDIYADIKQEREERKRFYNLLASLKRDGLVSTDETGKWLISESGRFELESTMNYPRHRYTKRDSKEVIVVSYDIPEKDRSSRDWFRSVLKLLDFKVLHQSVWIGKIEIPETLLADLRDRKIHSFIHIFTIGREGSLTQIL